MVTGPALTLHAFGGERAASATDRQEKGGDHPPFSIFSTGASDQLLTQLPKFSVLFSPPSLYPAS